ncbi:MAG: DNA mismatch repair protein MutS [Elusimicrobiota bacterium]|jgi:DNA mismatch repair protein MutS
MDTTVSLKREVTPLMQQYQEMKARYPEEILFFRLGDFFELFDEDARRAAPILGIALTHRQQLPMCGVPAHSVDPYVAKLLKAGFRVAIADQMEDPALAKGLVKRQVVRLVTPGTLQEDMLLPAKRCNFLVALSADANGIGLAAIECSTGEFLATELNDAGSSSRIWDELVRLAPSEIVVARTPANEPLIERLKKQGFRIADLPATDFSVPVATERLKRLLGTQSLRGFGLENKDRALMAAGAAIRYYETTQCERPWSVQPLRTYVLDDFLQMDAGTLDHLDLVGEAGSAKTHTLLDILDHTLTPMGGRLLRRWVVAPLRQVAAIHERQAKVDFFVENRDVRHHLRTLLNSWPDMERILTRLCAGTLLPRDLAHLSHGLQRLPKVTQQLRSAHEQAVNHGRTFPHLLNRFLTEFPEETHLMALLERALVEAPPATLKDGGVIRAGYNVELDEIRGWIQDGKRRLLELEKQEREQTGIGSLKIGFNNIFGYYLEITKTHLARVPAHYIRKQTMVNGERYITPELKEFETHMLGAEERALRLETALAQELREAVLQRKETVRRLSAAVAELDVFLSLAEVAEKQHYVKPVVDESDILFIREGRHPVLENLLASGTLVPNDVDLDGLERQIVILTGPNMSGKSTYLRQTALIAILAQMGSYVPAAEARIGVLDYLFTRIGASDRLLEGESTFMVEMVETARILHHATSRSLVILDEVGRGTSTYDGMAIAWACIEYLNSRFKAPSAETSGLGPKVLFATHYLELTQLAQQLPGIHNWHVTVREWGDQVVFLHKVEPGPADRAYGIHVARLAGVPRPVLDRAAALLRQFERRTPGPSDSARQGSLFPEAEEPTDIAKPSANPSENDRLIEVWIQELVQLDLTQTTPLQALLKLQEWKDRITQFKKERDSL